jgi:hypothetical protein
MGSATKKKHEAYIVETSDESVATDVLDSPQTVLVLPNIDSGPPEFDFPGVFEEEIPGSTQVDDTPVPPEDLVSSLALHHIPEGGVSIPIGEVPAAGLSATNKAHVALLAFGKAHNALTYDLSVEGYATFVTDFEEVKQLLIAAQESGGPAQVLQLYWGELKILSKGFMANLPTPVLEELALGKGFPHPGLIGLHTLEGKPHPLAYWLDPYYGPDSSNKQEFVDKANARWELLQSGGMVGNMTLTDYLLLHPAEVAKGSELPPVVPPKILTPEEFAALKEEIAAKIELCKELYTKQHTHDEDLVAWANAKLDYHELLGEYKTATCTDPKFVKTAPMMLVSNAATYATNILFSDIPRLAQRLQNTYGVSELDATLVYQPSSNHPERFLFGTEAEKTELAKKLADRKIALTALKAEFPFMFNVLEPMLQKGYYHPTIAPLAISTLESPPTQLYHWISPIQKAKDIYGNCEAKLFLDHYASMRKLTSTLVGSTYEYGANTLLGAQVIKSELLPGIASETADKLAYFHSSQIHNKIPQAFRLWAKAQKIQALRALAMSYDMEPATAKGLTRAQVQNFLLGQFDHTAQYKYEESLKGPKTPKAKSWSPIQAPIAGPHTIAAGIMMPLKATFAEKRQDMADGLMKLAAALAATNDRPTKEEVKTLAFTHTSAPISGGAHKKEFFADPSGRTWMFKYDNAGGSKALAEEAAAEIFYRVGLPSVPVYTKTVDGQPGSIQPLVAHAGTISDHVHDWTQSDIDAMVRYHVASWVVGDHDGKVDNMLRTPGGGIVAIDQGQAWKFVGRDKLDIAYHPNAKFEPQPPVYHRAYQAALSGQLAQGVAIRPEAAVPIIDRFEKIDDDEFRKIILPVAKSGVKVGLPWVGPMTKVAAKTSKIPDQPTADEVAQAFVETIVARKQNLRTDFVKFFSKLGFATAQNVALAVT